ncbi:hypothetical protein, partial [Novacetimonas hansenii]
MPELPVHSTRAHGSADSPSAEARASIFGIDLAFERTMDFDVVALPKLLRHQILGAGAQPVFDVIAGDHEVAAILGYAAHEDSVGRQRALHSCRFRHQHHQARDGRSTMQELVNVEGTRWRIEECFE